MDDPAIVRRLKGVTDLDGAIKRSLQTNLSAIEPLVEELIAKNPDKAEQARAKPALIGWFVGQVIKASDGKANPKAVNELLRTKLGLQGRGAYIRPPNEK